jgi:hypothetical protein
MKEVDMMRKNWHDGVFFGLHFDLHAGPDDQVGAAMSVEHLVERLGRVRPDFVQCDCKGHPGYSSYPTKIGTPAPHIVKDSLRMWRDATRQLGIPLIVHYSGIWDTAAMKAHPEWGRWNGEGYKPESWMPRPADASAPDVNMACPLSAYTVDYLAAQMLEIIDEYDVDGFWVDGENWATAPCYCPICVGGYISRFHPARADAPHSPEEEGWHDWLAYSRSNFDGHVRKYADIVHQRKPSCTVCSNWMYTLRQPDPVTVPVDYLSGDFNWIWSTKTALVEARFMDGRGLPWDLMAWGFTSYGPMKDWTFKSVAALCQEAGVVLSCGGAFMVYDQPNRSGDIIGWHMDDLALVAGFCRERQEFSTGTSSVPQIAILHSRHHVYSTNKPLYGQLRSAYAVEGALHAMLELGFHADILQDEKLLERMGQYPVVIIPEQTGLPASTVTALKDYVKRGGRLLVSGTDTTCAFDDILGIRIEGDGFAACGGPIEGGGAAIGGGSAAVGGPAPGSHYLQDGPRTVTTVGDWRSVHLTNAGSASDDLIAAESLLPSREGSTEGSELESESIAASREGNAEGSELESAAFVCRQTEEGRIASIFGNVFEGYADSHYPGIRRFLGRVVDSLGAGNLLRVKVPLPVHATLRKRDGQLMIHLVNLGSDKPLSPNNAYIEGVPTAGPIGIDLPLAEPPFRVRMQPGNRAVAFRHEAGRLHFEVDHCATHEIIVVDLTEV